MSKLSDKSRFKKLKYVCINKILDLHHVANAGHISSSLSCLDLILYSHFFRMMPGDKFILSKGHSASALYVVLAKSGKIPLGMLQTYYKDGTYLAAHPPCGMDRVNGITFGTGSLGHGLSLSIGLAFSNKFTKKNFNTYCLISDGECNEGSTWEAALFAGHHSLRNLFVLIDKNGLQAFGKTSEVANLEPLEQKWRSFNFDVVTVNGHDFNQIDDAFKKLTKSVKPKCIIAETNAIISFMKDKVEWHYLPLNAEQYKKAKNEVSLKNA